MEDRGVVFRVQLLQLGTAFTAMKTAVTRSKKYRKEKQIENKASWDMIKAHKHNTLYNNNDEL